MKTSKIMLLPFLFCIAISLSAFWSPQGGEGFEIFLDNKVVIQKFNHEMKQSTNLSLKTTLAGSKMSVKFYHCGMLGKERVLMLKDAHSKLLKQWDFSKTDTKNFSLSISVSEVKLLIKKARTSTSYLYYVSKETGGERLLTGISL